MAFKNELETLHNTYQQTIDALKAELRTDMLKQVALMKVLNTMADEIAQRNLLIEELCDCVESKHVEVAQRARERIKI